MSVKKYNGFKVRLNKMIVGRLIDDPKRRAIPTNLQKAKTVGILFVVNQEKDLELVRGILRQINNENIQTFALGYIPTKKPGDFYLSQKSFNFFSDIDLDFVLRPKSQEALEFIDSKFDILIDMGTMDYYPMQYIVYKSKAKFKIGWFGNQQPFDLMMSIDPKKGINYYFEQILFYLQKFN
jgi:hypothetical protein